MSFTPTFGISQLTQFQYSATATDPDGDTVTYSWDIASNPSSNASGVITFSNGGNGTAKLTISDGKGGSASDSRTFVVGWMTGNWSGTIHTFPIRFALTQNGGTITGTFSLTGTVFSGQLDPAATNTINSAGHVVIRCKVTAGNAPPVSDFTLTGDMDTTGIKITGGVTGSGFSGQPFTLTKE
jgi:hypothetical protein